MFLLKRPAIWFWCVAAVLVPPLGLAVGPVGSYVALRTQDRPATYAYLAVLLISALWLSWVLEGTIAL
ncbi:MAG TPA: hypothetical protein VKA36_08015 [Solirubrobacterales bacterium]|nr:hypothetical protein [Solirubrobacterales bacterium]